MSDDLHSPTTAGPSPAAPSLRPTRRLEQPPADRRGGGRCRAAREPAGRAEQPEVLVGAAFAGGLVAAIILKRLGR